MERSAEGRRQGRPAGLVLRHLLTVLLLAPGLLVAGTLTAPPAAAVTSWTIDGKGYGHGRGMGQWGAYGYATQQGWSHTRITDHFYGGTRLASDAGNPGVRVHLLGQGSSNLHVTGSALRIDGVATSAVAVRVRRLGPSSLAVDTGPGCAGPWTALTTVAKLEVAVSSATDGAARLCLPTGTRGYRGSLVARDTGTALATVNAVALDGYLAGVLPSEVPPSWGSATNGMAALRAQAVAARSYALAAGYRYAWADTCDTTACQVYSGTSREDSRTTQAVRDTSGQVRRWSVGGAVARTEFSASTGGRTAGGAFPSVDDAGDAVPANPNRSWTTSVTAERMGSATGVGVARSVKVDRRDGNGTWGGRVTQVTVTGTTGQRTLTGDQFRSALGLKSTYIDITVVSDTDDRAYVQALYTDVLGRAADPAGLDSWSRGLTDGSRTKADVARAVVRSDEHGNRVVTGIYQNALRRTPAGGEQAGWVTRLRQGESLVDVTAAIYGSAESARALGAGDVRVWVDTIYRNELGRPADASGLASWSAVAARDGRAAAARGILSSVEAAGRRLNGYYERMLGRAVDPAGRTSWLPVVRAGRDYDVLVSLALSAEYWNRAQVRFGDG